MRIRKKELSIKRKLIKLIGSRYADFIKSHYSQQRKDSFRALISVLLSQRTKEELTLKKDRLLFDKLHLKPEDFLAMNRKEIEKLIFPVGFYRQKAKRIKEICRILKEKHKGKVPETREELLQLPGIGKKSADVVLNSLNGKVIAMDVNEVV